MQPTSPGEPWSGEISWCVEKPDLGQGDALVTDEISGKHKVLVVVAACGALVRRRIAGAENFLTSGKDPTRMDAFECDNGECIRASLQDAQLEWDDGVARKVLRMVDIHVHDKCSSSGVRTHKAPESADLLALTAHSVGCIFGCTATAE